MSTPQGDYRLELRSPVPVAGGPVRDNSAPAPGTAAAVAPGAVPQQAPSRDPKAGPAPDTALLGERLRRVPRVADLGNGDYEFGDRDASGIMQLQVVPASVRVLIPRSWLPARGPQVFALVFMMAEWLSWEVHDPQIGQVLKKDTVLQGLVAMRQAQLAAAGTPVPKPVWKGPADAPRPPGMADGDMADDDHGGGDAHGVGRGPQEG